MKRRDVIALLGAGAASVPVRSVRSPQMPIIGLIGSATATAWVHLLTAFRQGLREAGYDEGRNVTVEDRWAHGQYDLLRTIADDLVHRRVSLLVAFTTPAALAAKAATATIPVSAPHPDAP